MSEGIKYKPEDVLEQKGENKGNISDKDLAAIGAEAEGKERDKKARNWFQAKIGNQFGTVSGIPLRPAGIKDAKHYGKIKGNRAGEQAMVDELDNRAVRDGVDVKDAMDNSEKVISDSEKLRKGF